MDFKKENNDLLKFILNASFFKGWKDSNYFANLHSGTRRSSLELYITSDCGQNCEYCYLKKFGHELYPKEIRNKETILSNLDKLLKYVTKKLPLLETLDIFSGEIVGEPIFFEILDLIIKYKQKGANYKRVLVPSNFSFILYNEKKNKIENYIKLLKENEISLILSASLDGAILEDKTRPQNIYSARDEKFYDNVFSFCKKYHFCFHPMISAYGINDWIENYKWWIKKCEEYDFNIIDRVMTLEVRNDDWTDEKIAKYMEFLKFYFNYHLNNSFKGPEGIARHLIGKCSECSGYINLLLTEKIQIPACSISYNLTVRLGDLSIAPCHRLSYNDFLYGKFIVKDDEIVDIEAYNPLLATKILLSNQRKSHHGCDVCWNKNNCIKGCFGSQYENGQEIFMPLDSVCKMLKSKTNLMIKLYEENGIFDALKELKKIPVIENDLIDKTIEEIELVKQNILKDKNNIIEI